MANRPSDDGFEDAVDEGEIIELALSHPEEAEGRLLAMELATTYKRLVDDFRTRQKLDAAEADEAVQRGLLAAVQGDQEDSGVYNLLPQQVDWWALTAMAQHNPHAMARCWQAINQWALDQIQTGFRAAEAIAVEGEKPWERAQFLARRASLILDWAPRPGVEMMLVDTLAQAHALQERWLKILTTCTITETKHRNSPYNSSGVTEAPRLSDAQAAEHAAGMVDRFNRIMLRSLRSLRDLRRYAPPVIMHAQQVNVDVGGQQMNITGALVPELDIEEKAQGGER